MININYSKVVRMINYKKYTHNRLVIGGSLRADSVMHITCYGTTGIDIPSPFS